MCYMWLAENTGHKKNTKNSPSRHHCIILSGCIFATKACIDNWKKNLLNSNIPSTCPHNMVNFGPLMAEISLRVWGTPANFNGFRVFASLLHRCHSTEVNQTLHDAWPSRGWYTIYTFSGTCPLTEFCKVQNSLCIQVLHSAILAALLHGIQVVGVSQTLRHWAEVPRIFSRAAITLGIGPHSSCEYSCSWICQNICIVCTFYVAAFWHNKW